MATLTAFKFPTVSGAEDMFNVLMNAEEEQLIQVQDAAIVTWPVGQNKPKTQQLAGMVGEGALGGAFWGLLFGLIFFVPILGLAVGAAVGALAGKMSDYGISDEFIGGVRQQVTEGTSALFLLTSSAVLDKLVPRLQGLDYELITSNLTLDQEEALRYALAHDGEMQQIAQEVNVPAVTAVAAVEADRDTVPANPEVF